MKTYFVYLLSNSRLTLFYTGVTNNIMRRMSEHKTKFNKRSFTARYNCDRLMYYEEFNDIRDAIHREKQLKKYHRKWKIELIESMNPD
jgi:putative endonuclease